MYSRGQKFWEWHKYKFSQNLLPQFVWRQFAYTPECYAEWSDELQLIAKSLFAMQINFPQKTFALHFSPDTKEAADMSVILSLTQVCVDEDKAGDHSVMQIDFE